MMVVHSFVLLAVAGYVVSAFSLTDPSSYATNDIIIRDVAVIGGGSSGTYGAIALKDLGKSIVVVEKEGVLGGHTNTYFVPETGVPIDYGVQAYWNQTIAYEFFARFNIPVVPYTDDGQSEFYDFSNGEAVSDIIINGNLTNYVAQLYKYPELLTGYTLDYPVADDLLMKFGDFVTKYSLEDEVWNMQPYLGGIANPANLLEQTTLNVMTWFDRAYIDVANGDAVVTQKPYYYNGEVFARAKAELESVDSVLVNSTVIQADRNCIDGQDVCLAVKTPQGTKLIVAKKLLITIPPVPWNMEPFGLDRNELGLFSTFNYSGYYAGLVKNTGLDGEVVYWNAGLNTTYHLPTMPGSYYFTPTNVAGISMYWYGSPTLMSQEEVETSITEEVHHLTFGAYTPEFVAFADHSPFKLVVSADEIANGFYEQLLALQGQKNTWYSGAAFVSHNSVALWNYTSLLVPDIVASLG